VNDDVIVPLELTELYGIYVTVERTKVDTPVFVRPGKIVGL